MSAYLHISINNRIHFFYYYFEHDAVWSIKNKKNKSFHFTFPLFISDAFFLYVHLTCIILFLCKELSKKYLLQAGFIGQFSSLFFCLRKSLSFSFFMDNFTGYRLLGFFFSLNTKYFTLFWFCSPSLWREFRFNFYLCSCRVNCSLLLVSFRILSFLLIFLH